MQNNKDTQAKEILSLPKTLKPERPGRKSGLNQNKQGSVRKVNNKVYVDFIYLGERVREPAGLPWNAKNARVVRSQLDKITVEIDSGTFRFADVFHHSKKANYFTEKERALSGDKKCPEEVFLKDYFDIWYGLRKGSGKVTGRTLLGYKSHIDLYLKPFFGDMTFAELNPVLFDEFIVWVRKLCLRKKEIANATINKIFIPLRSVCNSASIKYGWGDNYNPFDKFKSLEEDDPSEKIFPFSIEEQRKIISSCPSHWRPFFKFAFSTGVRQGEQIALKPEDINWSENSFRIKSAMTLDENGQKVEGRTKNRRSRRTIKMIPVMRQAIDEQHKIYSKFKGEYFFCATTGKRIDSNNLRERVWKPALEKAGIKPREMRQTRHSFATLCLSQGEDPLWLADVMGHRNTEMIIKVYAKYNGSNSQNNHGHAFNKALSEGQD